MEYDNIFVGYWMGVFATLILLLIANLLISGDTDDTGVFIDVHDDDTIEYSCVGGSLDVWIGSDYTHVSCGDEK